MKQQTYHRIIRKAIASNSTGFREDGEQLLWSGPVRARKKSTGEPFDLTVGISVRTNRFTREGLKACLCKTDGFQMKDLVVASMVDTKLLGKVTIDASDGHDEYDFRTDLLKFIKAEEQEASD
jgi:hypothetical protein